MARVGSHGEPVAVTASRRTGRHVGAQQRGTDRYFGCMRHNRSADLPTAFGQARLGGQLPDRQRGQELRFPPWFDDASGTGGEDGVDTIGMPT